ncbi:multidrug efflux system membrane fusion protein [Edaphobacter lichenicola]|uniref:Multidrug efflux system membrane fusion protein n=2 Tax=Tunturiibacter gelidiferens TaxID=3069689 RepID=A0A9X0QJ23_9BACT|nr:efflux RND transporter periplasmic adaptor subunit [Edaphobacter lichenicola]MBB5331140.1 multidrug efflux system membrane fusion protein [Edaphobacter lichenicola]
MSKLNAKQQGTAVVTGISSGIVSDTARRRLVEWGFFARRTPSRHFLLVCMCAVSVAISLAGCRQSPDKRSFSPAAVEVAAVVPKPIHLSDEFNGRVASINSVDVRARVTGYVDNVAYREGDSVKRGDPLFVIDPRPYRDALDSAKASLEREKAAAAFANIQAKRAQTLNASNAISQEEYQNRDSDLSQSIARVHEAEAAVATAELNLSFTEVRSPVDGRTSRAQLTRGNLAQADQTVLTTVVSQDPVYVYFDCDEQSYLRFQERVHRGSGVSSANPVRVALANETGFPHVGRVDFLDNQVTPSTGTIRARVVLPNPDHLLVPGLYARVQLESSGTVQALLVDDRAILTDQEQKYVYVVGPGNVAQRKDVVTGSMADGLRLIRTGLSPGDKVIVSGLQQIYFPGAPVAPTEVAMGLVTASITPTPAQEAQK